MLAKRKNKPAMKSYFNSVEERRTAVDKKATKNLWSRAQDDEDPLTKWKAAKARGEIKDVGYEAPPPSRFGTFEFPLNPIGMPAYDNGERFDLRLPYAERGYVDEDADVIGKAFSGLKGLFGGGKKATEKDNGKAPPAADKKKK
jgi:hypothetical protein